MSDAHIDAPGRSDALASEGFVVGLGAEGDTSDLELRVGFDDSENFGAASGLSLFRFFYGS